jgi:hypothetical protein
MNQNLIHNTRRRSLTSFVLATLLLLTISDISWGQQGYGNYYGQKFRESHGQLGTQTPQRYLYDKYFYHSPAVSPYANIGRLDTASGTAYQAYVRPEQERRQATMVAQARYIDARKKEGKVGETRFPGATFGQPGTAIMKPVPSRPSTPSAYYNHWYGGWKDR